MMKTHETHVRPFSSAGTTGGGASPRPRKGAGRWTTAAVLFAAAAAAGCEFTVLNPGPVADPNLDHPRAHEGVVNGAGRELSWAVAQLSFPVASVTRESMGRTGRSGVPVETQQGFLPVSNSGDWNRLQRSRWIAEDGARRLERALEAQFNTSAHAARILLYAGFANRYLSANFCEAVIDGGPAEPYTVYLERAEEAFTRALQIARAIGNQSFEHAALAGRASVHVYRGNWTAAVNDAQQVPTGFEFEAEFNTIEELQGNPWYFVNLGAPYRGWSVWNSPYYDYYLETGDPRVEWEHPEGDPTLDSSLIGGIRPIHYRERKFPLASSPIRMAGGQEMRLIEAEALLRGGDWNGALQIMNALRAGVGVAPWTAQGLNETWTHLKRERGIAMWLEARRLGDIRRWDGDNSPGDLHPIEVTGGAIPFNPQQSLCFPIPDSERETNPNFR